MPNKPYLLILEKDKQSIPLLKEMLRKSYRISFVETEEQAADYAIRLRPDLILLDKTHADLNIGEVIGEIRQNEGMAELPVLVLLSAEECDDGLEDFMPLSVDFVVKPYVASVLLARIRRLMEVQKMHRSMEEKMEKQKEQINLLSLQSILTIAQTVDARDRYAKGHSIRVALFCREIADKLGWSEKDIENLYYIALLHDIGKIAVEDAVLNKASALTEEEYEQVKEHTEVGGEMVKNTSFIHGVEEAVRYHHERYDGTGYAGLSGKKIPLAARIIAVADAYEAMTSDRAYRKRLSKEEAREELIRGRGSQFDPVMVDTLLELLDEGLSVDVNSVEDAFESKERIGETGDLLRQVFTETVQEAQIERERDSLTGFLNRKYFEERVNVFLLRANACGTFFMMDLDDFKTVNDTYGHVKGDELIQAFAEVIRVNTRDNDYVCRIGGDEFAIFFPELHKESVIRKRAENIIHLFSQKKVELGCEICSVSIGIMTKYAKQKPVDCTTLYNNADKALYYVKNNGKDDYRMYANIPEEERNSGNYSKPVDLRQLMRRIEERKYHHGAYAVEYDRFAYIYQFIARNIERSKQEVQIILFTLQLREGVEMSEDRVEDTLMLLETAIVRSLRRGDVTTRLSATQQIVVLMDTNQENGKIVAERIMKKYEGITSDNSLLISYDITEVPVKKA